MAKIIDCNNEMVVVSARSITIKDEYDKTRGVVRNVGNLYELRPNIQFDLCRKIETNGLPRNAYWGFMEQILYIDGALYVLVDDYSVSVEEQMKARWEPEYYTPCKQVVFWKACENCPYVTVIHCKRVFRSKPRK